MKKLMKLMIKTMVIKMMTTFEYVSIIIIIL